MKKHQKTLKTIALWSLVSVSSIMLASSISHVPPGVQEYFFEQAQAKSNTSYRIIGTYKAPNDNIYILLQKTSTVFSFRRPDGTTATKTFRSKLAVTSYLRANNSKKETILIPAPKPPAPLVSPTIPKPVSIAPTPVIITKTRDISYEAPSGNESMKVSVTTKDGIITQTSVIPEAGRGTSLRYQQGFAANLSGNIVGKAIKGLQVNTISGASLTTWAFNDFLASISY